MLRVTSGGEAGSAAPYLDVRMVGVSGASERAHFARGFLPLVSDSQFFTATTGAPAVVSSGNGLAVYRMISVLNTIIGKLAPITYVPLDRNHLLFPIVPAGLRQYRRYTFEMLAWRTNVTTPLVQFSIGIRQQAGDVAFGGGGGVRGYELHSVAEVNGGRWTVKRRLVSAGAVSTLTDSGLDPLTPRVLRFQFTEGPVSQLVISIDGVQVYATAGVADLPTNPLGDAASSLAYQASFMQGGAGAAGATDYAGDAHFTIEEL